MQTLPPIYCKIRTEYLYDMDQKKRGEAERCVIFGITSITGRAILFNIMLPNGACYWRLPISAFFQKHFSRNQVPDMSVTTSYSCGTVLVTILVCIALIGWMV